MPTLATLVALTIVALYLARSEEFPPAGVAPPATPPTGLAPAAGPAPAGPTYRVSRVVDGDTIILDGIGRVRLIGVNSPESVDPRRPVQRFGKDASDFLRRLVDGKPVRIAYDWERKDGYGRTLAYVYLADGTFVNETLIREGYAYAFTRYPFKHADAFRRLEREARNAGKGLWADRASGRD